MRRLGSLNSHIQLADINAKLCGTAYRLRNKWRLILYVYVFMESCEVGRKPGNARGKPITIRRFLQTFPLTAGEEAGIWTHKDRIAERPQSHCTSISRSRLIHGGSLVKTLIIIILINKH